MTPQSATCANSTVSYPLTPLQEGMLYEQMTKGGDGVDVEQIVGEFHEPLDVEAFRNAWSAVLSLHEILRSRFFLAEDGNPRQQVVSELTHPLSVDDLTGVADHEANARINSYLADDRKQGFSIDKPPLSRVRVFLRGPQHYVLVWTLHHIILDGRSQAKVLDEVYRIYERKPLAGEDLSAPQPSFREHVEWVRKRPQTPAEAYWRERWKTFESPTQLPQAGVGISLGARSDGHDVVEDQLDKRAHERIKRIIEQHGLTKNAVLQALWGLILSRYSHERCVAFGSIRAGRASSPAGPDAVGMFINHVPTVVDVNPKQSLLELATAVRAQHLEVRPHEHAPLSLAQNNSGLPMTSALYDTLVMYDHQDLNGQLRQLRSTWKHRQLRLLERTGYPVTLLAHGEPTFCFMLRYDRRVFDRDLMQQLLEHLVHALEQFSANPEMAVAELRLLNESQRRRVVENFNDTSVDYPAGETLDSMFSAQVARTPEAVALVSQSGQWTYRELSERVDSVAASLLAAGVEAETVVGVMIDRSLEMMAALLGVIRAGGAYLPLNPEDPPARLQFMLENASARFLLTQRSLADRLDGGPGDKVGDVAGNAPLTTLLIEEAIDAKAAFHRDVFSPATIRPDQLAYVLYTSGSTGRPKGVMIEHRSICNRLCWMQETFGLTAEDRVFQKTPLTFDVSVWEVFWAILYGARIVLASPGRHRDPRYLVDTIRSSGITVMHFVPSMLRHFLKEDQVESCESLRCVVCSGEALLPEDVTKFHQRSPAELHNLYGPTEAAVDVSHWPCQREAACDSMPIGWPIANTRLYVLDIQGEPCPVGVPGELYIAGIQVARGYVNRDDLTAERFVPDSYSDDHGSMYRTGDRARWLPDGSIEFLGRCDFEVKLNGVRIDLGEIETALRESPEIDDCVVVLRKSPAGEDRLVAYYTACDDVSASTLRSRLREILPATMVPSLYMPLDEMPLSSAGKVARASLPEPVPGHDSRSRRAAVYRSELEKTIASIWSESLGTTDVRTDENFFDVGGQSMMLLAVHRKIEAAIGRQFPITKSLEHTTIAGLATFLEDAGRENPRLARAKARGAKRRSRTRRAGHED